MAGKIRKTEHSGPKKGSGAYWGRKTEAKRESNKKRRAVGKRAITVSVEESSLRTTRRPES